MNLSSNNWHCEFAESIFILIMYLTFAASLLSTFTCQISACSNNTHSWWWQLNFQISLAMLSLHGGSVTASHYPTSDPQSIKQCVRDDGSSILLSFECCQTDIRKSPHAFFCKFTSSEHQVLSEDRSLNRGCFVCYQKCLQTFPSCYCIWYLCCSFHLMTTSNLQSLRLIWWWLLQVSGAFSVVR